MITYKISRIENKNLILISVLALVITLAVQTTVWAAVNDASQSAATNKATSIEIKAQNYTSAVASITFPAGAPSATVSVPYNDVDSASPQVLGGSKKPVVTLLNNSGGTLTIWYNISTFTNDTVSSEHYLIAAKGGDCADEAAITNAVSFDADTVSVGSTTILAAAGNEKDIYLKIGLNSLAGKTGTSTFTILGES